MYQMHILLKKLVCATDSPCIIDNVMVTQIWKWACKKCTFMSLSEEMHFGNWQKEIFCEDKKKNSQLLSCRFVGENPAGLTFRCQLENATPISHFHLKKAKPFFPNASFLCFVQQKWLIVSEFTCHLYMSSYTKFWLVSTCSCLLYTIKLKL